MKRALRPQTARPPDAQSRTPSPPNHPRSALACVRCSLRKVKCDRNQPCAACVKHRQECVFQSPKASRKRRRSTAEADLLSKLSHFESLLKDQSRAQACISNGRRSSSNTAPKKSPLGLKESSGSINTPRVVLDQGDSLFINNGLWSRVIEEFNNPAEVLQGSSQANAGFFFSLPTSTPPHPPTTQIDGLWSVFVQNVDPLTKVFHVPTLKPAFHHASRKIEAVPARFEALMFAIYSAAVMSLTDTECQSRFQEPREVMRRKFINATQVALSHANFIATKGLVVLQALVLHIISAADVYEPRALWTLTGVAVRLASGMGIDRDGTILGLSPFDTEIRRRVWWIINALDIRSAELCGLPKFRGMDLSAQAPKRPADVNDADIYPHMPAIPRDSECMTDATFISIRYDLLGFAGASVSQFRHLDKDPGQWDEELASKDQGTQEIEEHLETKYLRHCDPSQPLQLLSMLMARSAVDTIRFMTHHPRRWAAIDQAPPSERQFLWDVCIRLLEQRNMLQSTPLLDRFAWQAPFVIQWSAFIHVLDCLLTSPHGPDVDRAWLLVGETFRNNPKILGDWSKSLHWVVGSLCLRAYEARAAEEPTPDFILMLRGARDALAASQRPEPEISNTSGRLSSGDSHSSSTDGELIGLINSLDGGMTDDGFVSNNMDLPIYAEGLDSINWEQWDSLLEASHTQ